MTALSHKEEEELATCLKLLSRWGFGLTRKETLEVVGEFITATGKESPFVDGIPGEDWLESFMKRHPELSTRLPEQLKSVRAKTAANKDTVSNWFKFLKETLVDNDLLDKPERIYNVDESGFPLDPKRLKVISQKGIPHLFRVIGGSGRENITVQGCGRADGVMLPPYVLYSAKNLRLSWTEGGPENAKYNVSEKGWMDQSCFHDWFCNHFIPFLPPPRPVVLIFDGHASHLNPETIKEAVKNQVIVLKLPPNSTHFLQPLDVGVYGPTKTAWEAILVKFARQNLGVPLSKELFPSLLKALWESPSLGESNVKAGFRRCGVMPLDASVIPVSIYESSELFHLMELSPTHPNQQPSTSQSASMNPQSSASPMHFPLSPSTPPVHLASMSPSTAPAHPPTSDSERPSSAPPTESVQFLISSSAPLSQPPTTSMLDPSSAPPTTSKEGIDQDLLPDTTVTLKDFFMRKLTPLLRKPQNTNVNRKRAVKRQYGESLTSEECISRLLREEEEKKKPKGKGKGKGKRTVCKENVLPVPAAETRTDSESSDNPDDSDIDDNHIIYDDSDDDPDWAPAKKVSRNLFDKMTKEYPN